MALLGDTLKWDKVHFQNSEAKLQNELRAELRLGWSKYTRLIFSPVFISFLGITDFWDLSNITEIF